MCDACTAYAEAGFTVCNICGKPVTVASKPKASRKRETRAKTPDWDTTSVKPRVRKGDGSAKPKPIPMPKPPKTVISLLKTETKQRIVGIKAILKDLVNAGMDTDSKIADGLRTGRVVQAIGWEKNYQKVIDYLIAEGYNVGKHRFYIVCGSEAA